MAFFYEIRSADNTVLKRDGGFASQDAAKIAGRADAKKMKNIRQPDSISVQPISWQLRRTAGNSKGPRMTQTLPVLWSSK